MSRTDPRRANGHRRNQLRARLLATTTVCEVCGEALNRAIPPGHPLAPEVDERVPIAAGGNPLDRGGTRLIHAQCNKAEWQRWRRRVRRVAMPVVVTARSW